MSRALLLLVVLAACASPVETDAPATDAAPSTAEEPATSRDTVTRYSLGEPSQRPAAPVPLPGACPFECCTYGAWTTSETTTVYARPDDSTSTAFTIPRGTVVDADTGHVTVSRLGQVVLSRPTTFTDGTFRIDAEAGESILLLSGVGEGAYEVWIQGRRLVVDGVGLGVVLFHGRTMPEGAAFPETAWWAHVTTPDGRAGWLWMDRTPTVIGADGCA